MATTVDKAMQKLSRMTLIVGMAAAVVGVPVAMVAGSTSANAISSSSEAEIIVTVEAAQITITSINGSPVEDTESVAVKTLEAKNEVHFKSDRDARIKIMLQDDVVWEGDVVKDQPVTAEIDLTGKSVGVYSFTIRAYLEGLEGYSSTFFHLDYTPTIPSIIPGGDVNAPNTGLYFTVGGRIYSGATIALVVLLTAVVIFLIASKYNDKEKQPARATAKSKSKKKMDLI